MRWKLPKSLLVVLITIITVTTLAGMSWIFLKFNIPYVHGGDKFIVWCAAFFYWLVATVFIFGFELSE